MEILFVLILPIVIPIIIIVVLILVVPIIVVPIIILLIGKIHVEGVDTDHFQVNAAIGTRENHPLTWIFQTNNRIALWAVCLRHVYLHLLFLSTQYYGTAAV